MFVPSDTQSVQPVWSLRKILLSFFYMVLLALVVRHSFFLVCTVSYTIHNPWSTAFMNEQLSEDWLDGKSFSKQQNWVPYSQISNNLKRAVLAAEDAKFVTHHGFDWDGMRIAWQKNIRKGHIVAGGSTVSQQLAKNLFLSPQRTVLRKMDEALMTVMLEGVLSKERIFEIYLNVIEWGDGIYGAEAAAHYYFGTSASRLTARQAAYLASMIPNPRYFQKHRYSVHLNRKIGVVLARMRQTAIP